MFPPNGQKNVILTLKTCPTKLVASFVETLAAKKMMISALQWHSLVQNKPGPSSWASPQRIKATFIAVVLPIKKYLSSTCLNMHQHAIPAQNFILFLFCTSSFEVFHSKTDMEFGLAAGLPLCRRAYHVRFECTWALLPKGQDSFVLRRLSWSECVVLVDYGDFHQRSKMKTFFQKWL